MFLLFLIGQEKSKTLLVDKREVYSKRLRFVATGAHKSMTSGRNLHFSTTILEVERISVIITLRAVLVVLKVNRAISVFHRGSEKLSRLFSRLFRLHMVSAVGISCAMC